MLPILCKHCLVMVEGFEKLRVYIFIHGLPLQKLAVNLLCMFQCGRRLNAFRVYGGAYHGCGTYLYPLRPSLACTSGLVLHKQSVWLNSSQSFECLAVPQKIPSFGN